MYRRRLLLVIFLFISTALFSFLPQESFASSIKVTALPDGHTTVSKKIVTVKKKQKASFSIKAKKGYIFSKLVAGNCPAGKWVKNKYTTGPIVKSCKVYFSAGLVGSRLVLVTPSGDSNVTIKPNSAEKIITGTLAQFTVKAANAGHSVSRSVGGTCPRGVWIDSIYYKIGPVVKSCTVTFSSLAGGGGGPSFNVTPIQLHATIVPSTVQSVTSGGTASFQVTANYGYTLSTVAGNCPIGSWSGSTYTTGPITANCSVYFPTALQNFTVTQSGGGHETITPSTAQSIPYTHKASFQVIADSGYIVPSIPTGTCPAGSWNGVTYTTGAITADCSISFVSTIRSPNTILKWVDPAGNIYIADTYNFSVRKVDAITHNISTVVGTLGVSGSGGDGGPATSATFTVLDYVVVDPTNTGVIYATDNSAGVIRKAIEGGNVTNFAGTYYAYGSSGDGGPATLATLGNHFVLSTASNGNLYFTDVDFNKVRMVDSTTGIITTVAGTGVRGSSPDGTLAVNAMLNYPFGVANDANDNFYIGDNLIVKKVDSSGVLSTIAGNGTIGSTGDGGPATSAQLAPADIAFDSAGFLYISDYGFSIRKVDLNTGIISTVAGSSTSLGYSGDGGMATSALLNQVKGLAVDAAGDLYLGDTHNHAIRKVDMRTGIITTVAGTGVAGNAGDGGPATSAQLNLPFGG